MNKAATDEAARIEWEKEYERSRDRRPTPAPKRTSYGRSTGRTQDPVVKVLTSATFIRGVFGILKKVM